ncbi:MAG: hypothetical protein LBR38_03155, partial [Synergistaceae bacterium]|nr:hypothetical protein [Synergistaceae bacterium]
MGELLGYASMSTVEELRRKTRDTDTELERTRKAMAEIRKTLEETSRKDAEHMEKMRLLDEEDKRRDAEHAERMRLLDEECKRLDAECKRLDAENKRLDAENKRLDAENKRLDAKYKRADEERKRAEEKRMARLNKQLGDLGNRFGDLIERDICSNLSEKFEELGYNFLCDGESRRILFDEHSRSVAEIDFLLENADVVIVTEIKANLTVQDVDGHVNRMKLARQYGDPRWSGRKLLGAVAGA